MRDRQSLRRAGREIASLVPSIMLKQADERGLPQLTFMYEAMAALCFLRYCSRHPEELDRLLDLAWPSLSKSEQSDIITLVQASHDKIGNPDWAALHLSFQVDSPALSALRRALCGVSGPRQDGRVKDCEWFDDLPPRQRKLAGQIRKTRNAFVHAGPASTSLPTTKHIQGAVDRAVLLIEQLQNEWVGQSISEAEKLSSYERRSTHAPRA